MSLAVVSLTSINAHASWPATDAESVQLGTAEALFFGPRQSVATTPDMVWVAWQDSYCTGDVRLQRIAVADGTLATTGGLVIQPDPTCGFAQRPLITALGDRVVATRVNVTQSDAPVIAYDNNAVPVWDPGFSASGDRYLTNWTATMNGDLLAVSAEFGTLFFDRLDADGSPVWPISTSFDLPTGANFQVRSVVPDLEDGAFIVVDSPLSYIRTVTVQRVRADGSLAWDEPIRPVPAPPLGGISRHTPPTAIADGSGGFYYIWTKGFESGTTPAPLMLQQVRPDGSLIHPIDGLRVSVDIRRQFDPIAIRHEDSGNIDIVWRNGQLQDAQIFAQRIAPDGSRLWSETGVAVADIDSTSTFDVGILDGKLVVVYVTNDGISAREVSHSGLVGDTWSVTSKRAANVRTATVDRGVVVIWQADGPELNDTLEAQRLNPRGRLGEPACAVADLGAPFGVLDLADIAVFVSAFLGMEAAADIASPLDVFDLSDVQAFVTSFVVGCP